MKVHKATIPFYGGTLKVAFTDDVVKIANEQGFRARQDDNDCRGIAFHSPDRALYLIMIKKKWATSYDVIAHECLHISHYIMEDKGLKPSVKNDEAQAYLIGWIASQVQEAWEKHNK